MIRKSESHQILAWWTLWELEKTWGVLFQFSGFKCGGV